jgi:biopolymer transport protein TolQ
MLFFKIFYNLFENIDTLEVGTLVNQAELWDMVLGAGPMVKFVLLILLLFSIFSWAIIIYKVRLIRKMERETLAFYDLFWKIREFSQISASCKNYRFTPLSRLFTAIYSELAQALKSTGWQTEEVDRIKRILKRTATTERAGIEKSVTFLATTGNTAPFVGLFGTVWGIMNTFRGIGLTGTASLAVVAPGISEALIATAMGLFAAIPAVVGYNHILTRIDRLAAEMDNFSADMLNVIEKQFKKSAHSKQAGEETKGG